MAIRVTIHGIDLRELRAYAARLNISIHAALARLIRVGFHRVEALRDYNQSTKGQATRKRYEDRTLAKQRTATDKKDQERKAKRRAERVTSQAGTRAPCTH